jgi:CxxC motif-containing protein
LLHVDEQSGAVTGQGCARGEAYGAKELRNPTRVVTSTVAVTGAVHRRLPVKTDREVPKALIWDVMRALRGVRVAAPVRCGQVILPNVCGGEASVVATRDMAAQAVPADTAGDGQALIHYL